MRQPLTQGRVESVASRIRGQFFLLLSFGCALRSRANNALASCLPCRRLDSESPCAYHPSPPPGYGPANLQKEIFLRSAYSRVSVTPAPGGKCETFFTVKKSASKWIKKRMASLFKASQLRSAWSPEECGVFAAHKEFELLKLLSTADKKVISMARKMGHAAVNAQVNKQGAGAPGQPPHTRHQDSREPEGGRAASVSKTKRSKQERRQRKEAANKLQAMARSFIVSKAKRPAARIFVSPIDGHIYGEPPEAPESATGWADVVRRQRRRRSPDSASRSDPASGAMYSDGSRSRSDYSGMTYSPDTSSEEGKQRIWNQHIARKREARRIDRDRGS